MRYLILLPLLALLSCATVKHCHPVISLPDVNVEAKTLETFLGGERAVLLACSYPIPPR